MKNGVNGAGGRISLAAAALAVLATAVLVATGRVQRAAADLAGRLVSGSAAALMQPETAGGADETSARVPSAAEPDRPEAFRVPADVEQMEADYLARIPELSRAGTVTERFFRDDGATDTVRGLFVKNATASLRPDLGALLDGGFSLPRAAAGEPTVLVFHTHTTESYLPGYDGFTYKGVPVNTEDPKKNVVRVGDALCAALERRGVGTVHDTKIYDGAYEGAYARSRVSVLETLEKYPSVRVVLDVHRDSIANGGGEDLKPTAEIGGRKCAQVMIITGAEDGGVTDFPGWRDNLRFALKLQQKAEFLYPGLMRPIFFCPRKYNMDTSPCGLLLEFGTEVNTLAEALCAGDMIGTALAEVIADAQNNGD